MTEIGELPPELAAMLQQQAGVPNPAFVKARDAFQAAVREFERTAWARVQFFGPVLCSCEHNYDWERPSPPQQSCAVHGYVMADRETGAIFMFGIPREW